MSRRQPLRRSVGWTRIEGGPGAEWAEVVVGPDRLAADGVAVTSRPVPYRLDYRLRTSAQFVTRRLAVRVRGDGWSRTLDLTRSAGGLWSAIAASDGEHPSLDPPGASEDVLIELGQALDCDLGLCPLTNTMPVLRRDLLAHDAGPVEFLMAFVSVPDLAVRVSRQRYVPLGGDRPHRVRLESGAYRAEISFDPDGLVVDYPGLGRRLRGERTRRRTSD